MNALPVHCLQDPIWAEFTREPATLILGGKGIPGNETAETDVECATQCKAAAGCRYWSWCSVNATAG